METIHLVGTEQVERAAAGMRGAAADMHAAANNIQFALEQHQRFMQQWLEDFRAIMEKK